jgi:uncharacterized protein YbjT (DUF2867 family)
VKAISLLLALAIPAGLALIACTEAGSGTSKDSFVAASLLASCTHSVSDARNQKDKGDLELVCATYFRGLTDAMFVMQALADHGTRTCLPQDEAVGIPEARAVFQTYVRDHPESASNSAGLVATMALVGVHKCMQ